MTRCRKLAVAVVAAGAALPAVPASAEAARLTLGDRSLRPGMQGRDVRVLQDFLTRVGLATKVDGQYGPLTSRRVKSWERRSDRQVNGRVERRDARVLRSQVNAGITVYAAPAPAAPAPNTGEQAVLGSDGKAIAPESAPPAVKAVIAAGNEIVGKPYKYGGGHGRWDDSGYDCSGSMSYALHGGGLLSPDRAHDSSEFMRYGDAGPGQWITTYAHGGHSFMVVAGLRFDTGYNNAGQGPRWSKVMRPEDGYTVRHPPGL